MRVATSTLHLQGVEAMQRHNQALAKVQGELGSGLRFARAGEDPVAAGQKLSIEKALGDVTQWSGNIGSLRDRLNLTEVAYANVTEGLDRVRELAVQANTATVSESDRQSIVKEMRQVLNHLLEQANARDGQGRYLFGGSRDQGAPFERINGRVVYQGDSLVSLLPVGATREIASSDSGTDAFVALKSGDGRLDVGVAASNRGSAAVKDLHFVDSSVWDEGSYSIGFNAGRYEVRDAQDALVTSGSFQAGEAIQFRGVSLSFNGTPADGDRFNVVPARSQDIFSTVESMIGALSSYGRTQAQRAQDQTLVFSSLNALDTAIDHIGNMRGGVGARLHALDDAESQLEARSVQLQETLSGVQNVDYVEATARLSHTQLALQAAQQSYLRVQGMSLFDYLK